MQDIQIFGFPVYEDKKIKDFIKYEGDCLIDKDFLKYRLQTTGGVSGAPIF